jgi:mannose-6-phosphate isomerase-like protein (cupin superfamily)
MIRKRLGGVLRRLLPKKIIPPQTFRYQKPDDSEEFGRAIVRLCDTGAVRGSVHVVRRNGAEHLHSHETVDGFWMVLSGVVRFYGDNDKSLGEFSAMEGILVPRHNRYRFESVGDEDAEMLQVLHIDSKRGFQRENHEKKRFNKKRDLKLYDGRTDEAGARSRGGESHESSTP